VARCAGSCKFHGIWMTEIAIDGVTAGTQAQRTDTIHAYSFRSAIINIPPGPDATNRHSSFHGCDDARYSSLSRSAPSPEKST